MILEAILVILIFLLGISVFFCLKFAILILRVQDVIEESLDVLDERHASITAILQRPLFFDSQEVRTVLRDIEASRNSIHRIAYSMAINFDDSEENEG